MSVQWIEHKGREILYVDYRLKSPKQMLLTLESGFDVIGKSEQNILALFDYRDVPVGKVFMEESQKRCIALMHKKEKVALLGMNGIKELFFEKLKEELEGTVDSFDSEERAKEFLIS